MTKQIVIVGGGIAGLSAAHRLITENKSKRLPVRITLLEASDRLGGVIKSQAEQGYVIEHGPDSFVLEKPWAANLCKELGLAEELIALKAGDRRAYVCL